MASVLLVGAPNSGKTAQCNRLTGLNHRVATGFGFGTARILRDCLAMPIDRCDFGKRGSVVAISPEDGSGLLADRMGCGLAHLSADRALVLSPPTA